MRMPDLLGFIDQQAWLDATAAEVQRIALNGLTLSGSAGRTVANLLYGTWLGHPLHPALVAIPTGAWTAAVALDAAESFSGRADLARAADGAIRR